MESTKQRRERILVVEDDEAIRDLMTDALSDEGYEVVSAENGAAALDLAWRYHPSLILLDLRMPTMDGWSFSSAYRDSPLPHAPILVVTAARDAVSSATAIRAEAVLDKPFELDELLRLVASLAERPAATL